MNNNVIKEIYKEKKDKMDISYDEFISVINELYNSCELVNIYNLLKDINSSYEKKKSSEINLDLSEISENSLTKSSSTTNSSNEKLSIESIFLNEKINVINTFNNENFDSFFSSNLLNPTNSSSIDSPSHITVENSSSIDSPSQISIENSSNQSPHLKFNPKNFFKNTSKTNKHNNYFKISENQKFNSSMNDKSISDKSIFSKKTKNNKKQNSIQVGKINIKVNPNVKYDLDIDLNNNINISIM